MVGHHWQGHDSNFSKISSLTYINKKIKNKKSDFRHTANTSTTHRWQSHKTKFKNTQTGTGGNVLITTYSDTFLALPVNLYMLNLFNPSRDICFLNSKTTFFKDNLASSMSLQKNNIKPRIWKTVGKQYRKKKTKMKNNEPRYILHYFCFVCSFGLTVIFCLTKETFFSPKRN